MQLTLVGVEKKEPESEITFADFWLLYPRREAKKDAMKAWATLGAQERLDACIALVDWRRVFIARGAVQYIPLPASWIRGERWEDELPADFKQLDIKPLAHQNFKPEPEMARTPMPEKLRAMLATLRAKCT